MLECLLASCVLLATYNTASFSLHKILFCQATTCMFCSSVIHLCLCSNCGHLTTARHLALPARHHMRTPHPSSMPLSSLSREVHLYLKARKEFVETLLIKSPFEVFPLFSNRTHLQNVLINILVPKDVHQVDHVNTH